MPDTLMNFTNALDVVKQSALNVQAIQQAKQKHDQESEIFELNKKQKMLELDKAEAEGQITKLQRGMYEDLFKVETKPQEEAFKAKQTLIDHTEHQETQKAQQAGTVAKNLLQQDPNLQMQLASFFGGGNMAAQGAASTVQEPAAGPQFMPSRNGAIPMGQPQPQGTGFPMDQAFGSQASPAQPAQAPRQIEVIQSRVKEKLGDKFWFNPATMKVEADPEAGQEGKNNISLEEEIAKAGGEIPPKADGEDQKARRETLLQTLADTKKTATIKEQRIVKQNMLSNATALRKELNSDQVRKNFNTLNQSAKGLREAYKLATSPDAKSRIASDQALAVLFQKMLDPESVVRESEYARTPEGASLINRVESILPQLQKGGLALKDEDRKQLLTMAETLLATGGETYNAQIDRYQGLAEKYDLDPEMVVGGIPRFEKPDMESQSKSEYSVGQMINKGNKSWKVVGFDTDGEPLVEESR